jgi:hypothetical protein
MLLVSTIRGTTRTTTMFQVGTVHLRRTIKYNAGGKLFHACKKVATVRTYKNLSFPLNVSHLNALSLTTNYTIYNNLKIP